MIRGGFSLVEMVVSLAVVGVLTVGMASSMVLATRCLPHHANPAGATVRTAAVMQQLRDELRAAVEVTVREAHRVTINLPDRDRDGLPEVVTYAWSGSAGDPLMRRANGGADEEWLGSVADFSLEYTTSTRGRAFPGPPVTSEEQLLSSYVTNDTGNTLDHKLEDDEWIGTLVQPSLPAEAETWRITRALFYGNKSGGSGSTVSFELREVSGGLPRGGALARVDLPESEMGGWSWYGAAFSSPDFQPDQDVAIVLANYGGGAAGVWSYYPLDVPPSQFFTGDGEGGWSTGSSGEELQHFVYGTYQSRGEDWTYSREHVTAVDVTLVHGGVDAATQRLRLPLPNTPEAVDGLCEADFDADPTALDLDADGEVDWDFSGGSIPADRLADGSWTLDNGLELALKNKDFDQPATVRCWMQDTTDDGGVGGIELRLERAQGDGGVVQVLAYLEDDVQRLEVAGVNAASTFEVWCIREVPAGRSIGVELYIDPERDTVAVVLDGEDYGSFGYATVPVYNVAALGTVATSSQSGVRVDHLRVAQAGATAVTPEAFVGTVNPPLPPVAGGEEDDD